MDERAFARSARSGMHERALRLDERVLMSARFGARACEGTRRFRYAGQDCSRQQSLCAAQLCAWKSARFGMDERALRKHERALMRALPMFGHAR